MKRHIVLQPFSRDHNVGLVVARRLIESPGPESVSEFLSAWAAEMEDHFAEEERLLGPLASDDLRKKLFEDHREIREALPLAVAGELDVAMIRDLGQKLNDHIRWEERVLFPAVEGHAKIESLAVDTEAMEQRRHDSTMAPRRGELMDRRHPEDH